MTDAAKLTEVRERVSKALAKLSEERLTLPTAKGDVIVTVDSNRFYHEHETHLSYHAKLYLEQQIERFASDEIDEREMKTAISEFHRSCELAYYDQRFLIFEPSLEDWRRMQTRFDCAPAQRVVALEYSDDERIERLTRKVFAVFAIELRQHENSLISWKRIEDRARQCKAFAMLLQRRNLSLTDDEKTLFAHVTKITAKERYEVNQRDEIKAFDTASLTLVYDEEAEPFTTAELEKLRDDTQFLLDHEAKEKENEPDNTGLFSDKAEERTQAASDSRDLPVESARDAEASDEDTFALGTHPHVCPKCGKQYRCSEKDCATLEDLFCLDCSRGAQVEVAPEEIETPRAREAEKVEVTATVELLSGELETRTIAVDPSVAEDIRNGRGSVSVAFVVEDAVAESPKHVVIARREIAVEAEEELSEEDKALADAVEDDGIESALDEELEQGGLFGDISAEKITRRKMFADELVIDTAFNHHRSTGFPYRFVEPAMAMAELQKLAETEGKALISSNLAYQVADTFHRHRFHASANGMKAPYDSFHDDKKLRKAIRLEYKLAGKPRVWAGGMMTLVNGTQACSNFRPGFAAYLYREFCPDDAVVLDTSTGYGGRLLGAVASQKVKKYIGVDPNVPTFEANRQMIKTLHLDTLVEFELYNLPAEDVPLDDLRETCDFSFTSPPYFAKEIYSQDDTQSWKRYSTGEAWRDGFLKKMLELTFSSLKQDCFAIVNIADVKLKNKTYPLAEWTRELGQAVGFTFVDTRNFPMQTRFGKGMSDEVAVEPVIIFKKETKQ